MLGDQLKKMTNFRYLGIVVENRVEIWSSGGKAQTPQSECSTGSCLEGR